MKIRRRKILRERLPQARRAELVQQLEGKTAVANAVSMASSDLKQALKKARSTVAEAEEALAQGSRPFQEAMASCRAASAAACGAAATATAAGEMETKRTIDAVMQKLLTIANGLSNSIPGKSPRRASA